MYDWISYAANTTATTTTTANGTAWAVNYIWQIPPTNIVYKTNQGLWDYCSDPKKCEPKIDRDELLDFINS